MSTVGAKCIAEMDLPTQGNNPSVFADESRPFPTRPRKTPIWQRSFAVCRQSGLVFRQFFEPIESFLDLVSDFVA